MELMELMVVLGGRRDFFFRAGAARGATRGDSDRFVTPSKSHEGPVLWFLEQTGKFPESGWRVSGKGDGTPGKPCGTDTDQRPLPGAPSDTSEGPGRPRDRTSGKTCGTDQRRVPGASSDTSEGPGRPRDGTPGKIRGTDQRPLPGAPSDTSEGPGKAWGARSESRLCPIGPKSAPVCPQSA